MRRSVSTPDETLRRKLKIRHTTGLSIFDKLRGASSGDDKLRGASSGDEILRWMLDITSQTKLFYQEKLRMQ